MNTVDSRMQASVQGRCSGTDAGSSPRDAQGQRAPLGDHFEAFPPSFPHGPRVLTWRKIDKKKTSVFWVAAIYIENDKQVVFNHEDPIEAFSGAIREFCTKVLPTLPSDKREFLAGRLAKANVARAEGVRLGKEHRRS